MANSNSIRALALIFLTGCTTTLHSEPDYYIGPDRPVVGVPYSLPIVQFEVTLNRQISQCYNDKNEPYVDFVLSAEATPSYIAGETYVIDYSELSSPAKTSSFSLEFHEGTNTLKSINTSSSDKTQEISKSLVSTAVGLGSIIAGVPPITPAAVASPPRTGIDVLACSQGTISKMIVATQRRGALKSKSDTLKTSTEALTKKLATLAPIIAANALTETQKKEIEKLINSQTASLEAEGAAKKELEEILQQLTISHSFKWPMAANNLDSTKDDRFALTDLELNQWITLLTTQKVKTKPKTGICDYDNITKFDGVKKCLAEELKLSAILDPSIAPVTKTGNDKNITGLYYRTPVDGSLQVCRGQTPEECKSTQAKVVFKSKELLSIPQLGQLRLLPFSNGPFQDNELAVEFEKNGTIKTLSYKENSSRALGFAGTANDAVTQIYGFIEARDAAKEAELEKQKAETKEKEAEQQAALAAAQAAIVADRAETIALLTHEINLLKLSKDKDLLVNPPSISALQQLTTNAELEEIRLRELQAILAQLQARQAIAENASG